MKKILVKLAYAWVFVPCKLLIAWEEKYGQNEFREFMVFTLWTPVVLIPLILLVGALL